MSSNRKSADKKGSAAKVAKVASNGGKHPTVEMVRQLARIFDSHGLSVLTIETEEANITMRRGDAGSAMATAPMMAGGPMMAPAQMQAPAAAPAAPAPAPVEDNLHTVTTPFVGTFYRSPNPDSPAYAQVGDRVEKGQVLCIVEAMKLMNEIEADQAGTVAAVLVENGEPVEYGQALFKLAP